MSLRKHLLAAVGVVLLAVGVATAHGQQPDHRGEVVTESAIHQGVRASAPIPPEMHVRNEGGSDGAGLCVTSSILANGMYQGVPGLEGGKDSDLWRWAKRNPGGSHPTKLERHVRETMPGEKWASYVGRDTSILDSLSRQGYPIGATMNTGAWYRYQPIHHMVSLIHYRSGEWACVVDNNRPGFYSWMPASEFDRRWIDGQVGWAWIWTRLPPAAVASLMPALILLAAALLIAGKRRRESEALP